MATKKVNTENIETTETTQVAEVITPEGTPVEVTKKPNVLTKVKDGVKAIPNMTVKEFGKKILLPVTVVGGAIGGIVYAVNHTSNSVADTDESDEDYAADYEADEVTIENI